MHLDSSWRTGPFFSSPFAFSTHQLPPFCNPSCSQGVCAAQAVLATVSAANLALQMLKFSLHGVPTEQELPEGALWRQAYEMGRLHTEIFRDKMLMCISDGA